MTNPRSLLHPVPPTRQELQAFLDRHAELLQLERAEEEEQTRLLNSNCSPRELERKGLSLGGLGVSSIGVGLGGKSMIELHRPLAYHTNPNLPPHTFRTGDPARIESHIIDTGKTKKKSKDKDETDPSAVEGIVYRVSKEKIVLAVDGSKDVDLPERVRLLKLANSVTFDRMDRTLKHLRRIVLPEDLAAGLAISTAAPEDKTDGWNAKAVPSSASTSVVNRDLVDVLLGSTQPTWQKSIPLTLDDIKNGGAASETEMKWYGDRLNDSQKEAIEFCLKADQVACIHGPPGTGKTHTLVELIFQLLSRPASSGSALPPRILVTTPSNLALDNILLRLHTLAQTPPYSDLLPPGSLLRLGHPTRVHRELISQTLDWRASNGEDGELVRDVGKEIEGHLGDLGKKKGERGSVKGKERGNKWGEVRELRREYRQREAKVVKNVVNAAQVVLATCHSAGSRQINNMTFDVCIVDEATQAVEAVCWVPILKSRKLILAGDPKQLPPTILSRGGQPTKLSAAAKEKPPKTTNGEAAAEVSDSPATGDAKSAGDLKGLTITDRPKLKPPRTLEITLFDRLEFMYGGGIKRVLTTQYRMNETIASFPNVKLYESNLISAPSVAKRTLLDLPSILDPSSADIKDLLDPPVVFFDTAGCEFYERSESDGSDGKQSKGLGEGSKSNTNEAEIAVKWARNLVAAGVPPEEIAVVTPYQAQVALISEMIRDEYPETTIGSVDGLQGQEREAIILTLVRSNAKSEVGFLSEYKRLNVAMTRARRQLCVVGDSDTVGKGSKYLASWMKWLEDHADVRYAGDMLES